MEPPHDPTERSDLDATVPPRQGNGAPPPSPPPTHDAAGPGPTIPGVTLGAEIARGGMGVVYRGEQPYLARTVAVKVVAAYLNGDEFVRRFRREAQILAGISHPHIVACHDAGTTADGRCYLVMEYVDGPTLRAHCKGGPLPVLQAVRVLRDLALALQHAHEFGIIHRDVKPENVLLQRDERRPEFPFVPKLVDLGLARDVSADAHLTSPGMVMGTASTMAPEQFDDPDHVDHRADIYGLGCVAYYALTGTPAFAGGNLTATVKAKSERYGPDPRRVVPSIPPALGELVRNMMAGKREDRPQDYAPIIELCVELLGSTGAMPARPQPAKAPRPRARNAALIAASVVAGGIIARELLRTEPTPPVEPPPVVKTPEHEPPTGVPVAPPPVVVPPETAQPKPEPEPEPSPAIVSLFGLDLAALGWREQRPEGVSATAFVADGEGGVVGNCPRGEARLRRELPARFHLTGSLQLKPAWGERAAQRAAGIRIVPAAGDPIVLWIEPAATGFAIRLGSGEAWPPTAVAAAEGAPAPELQQRDATFELHIHRAVGRVTIAFGRDLLAADATLRGATRALADGACAIELFARDGTARFADFTLGQ